MPNKLRGRVLAAAGAVAGLAAAGAAMAVNQQRSAAERQHPPTGRFIAVDGVRLHYIDSGGDGTPVVMLHGNGAMIADLVVSGLFGEVAARHRTIVFDRPGFGYSERPASRVWGAREQAELLRAALRELGVVRPVLFGQSWGTLVALAMAIAAPDDVAGLVLASGFYYPETRADAAALSLPNLPIAGGLLRHTVAPFIVGQMAPKAVAKIFSPQPVTPRFEAAFPMALASRPGQIRASSEELSVMNSVAADLAPHYRDIRLPAAIIAGDADRIVSTPRQSERLAQEIAGSTLTVLPGMGHMLHHFETARVAGLIDEVAARGQG